MGCAVGGTEVGDGEMGVAVGGVQQVTLSGDGTDVGVGVQVGGVVGTLVGCCMV